MAVKAELIARLLAQVKDLQRQLVRVVALLTGHNSPRRTLRRIRFKNVAPIMIDVHCHQNRDLWDALQASKDFEKAFRAIEIPPITVPSTIIFEQDGRKMADIVIPDIVRKRPEGNGGR